MKLFINSNNEIHDVGSSNDTSLRVVEPINAEEHYEGRSIAKICCYAIDLKGDEIIGFHPYVPSSLISHIDQLDAGTDIIRVEKALVELARKVASK